MALPWAGICCPFRAEERCNSWRQNKTHRMPALHIVPAAIDAFARNGQLLRHQIAGLIWSTDHVAANCTGGFCHAWLFICSFADLPGGCLAVFHILGRRHAGERTHRDNPIGQLVHQLWFLQRYGNHRNRRPLDCGSTDAINGRWRDLRNHRENVKAVAVTVNEGEISFTADGKPVPTLPAIIGRRTQLVV